MNKLLFFLLFVLTVNCAFAQVQYDYWYADPIEDGVSVYVPTKWCKDCYPEKVELITSIGTFVPDSCINCAGLPWYGPRYKFKNLWLETGLVTLKCTYSQGCTVTKNQMEMWYPGNPKLDQPGKYYEIFDGSAGEVGKSNYDSDYITIGDIKDSVKLYFSLTGRAEVTIRGGSGKILFKYKWGAHENNKYFGEKYGPIIFDYGTLTQYPQFWKYPLYNDFPFLPWNTLNGHGRISLITGDDCSITVQIKRAQDDGTFYAFYVPTYEKWGGADTIKISHQACNSVLVDTLEFLVDTSFATTMFSSDSCSKTVLHEVKILQDTWVDTTFCRPQAFHEINVLEDTVIGIPGNNGCITYYDISVQQQAGFENHEVFLTKPDLVGNVFVTGDTAFTVIELVEGCEYYHYYTVIFPVGNGGKDDFVFFPNAFSPNGDGRNDYFYPYSRDNTGEMSVSLSVYSQLGSLVWERNNFPTNTESYGWDGAGSPEGLYYWRAEVRAGRKESFRRGIIWLKR